MAVLPENASIAVMTDRTPKIAQTALCQDPDFIFFLFFDEYNEYSDAVILRALFSNPAHRA
jgi:hypothetical protein